MIEGLVDDLVDVLRPPVRALAQAMEHKLRANDHKGQWGTYGMAYGPYFLARLREEVAELEAAILAGESPRAVLMEAADVANFALILADSYAKEAEEHDGMDGPATDRLE